MEKEVITDVGVSALLKYFEENPNSPIPVIYGKVCDTCKSMYYSDKGGVVTASYRSKYVSGQSPTSTNCRNSCC
jgi:hypothetical protein